MPLTTDIRIDLPVPFDGPALGENNDDGGNVSERAGDGGDLDQALLLRVGANKGGRAKGLESAGCVQRPSMIASPGSAPLLFHLRESVVQEQHACFQAPDQGDVETPAGEQALAADDGEANLLLGHGQGDFVRDARNGAIITCRWRSGMVMLKKKKTPVGGVDVVETM